MTKYIIRLDDACEKWNAEKWDYIESILDKEQIKPLVGIIPQCEDPELSKYPIDNKFWKTVERWKSKKWCIAMHGYNHVYSTREGGINPVNRRSEFAGEPLNVQKEKIKLGVRVLREHGINPKVFFAPSHTFDENTLVALKTESDIRIVSDTIANDCYRSGEITFVPQQSGKVRRLPFKTVTFCYHPNIMKPSDFIQLETFIKKYKDQFIDFPLVESNRELNIIDKIVRYLYFARR